MTTGLGTLTLSTFLDQLGAKTPAPGGGAVACSVGAIAASLARMVVAYSLGKKNLAEHQPALQQADSSLQAFSSVFLRLADEDAAAYSWVNELQKLPPGNERRERELSTAQQAALGAPRATLGAACDLLRLVERLTPITNRFLRSDLAIAGVLAESTARSAWWNVLVNLEFLSESDRSHVRAECEGMLRDAERRRRLVESACA